MNLECQYCNKPSEYIIEYIIVERVIEIDPYLVDKNGCPAEGDIKEFPEKESEQWLCQDHFKAFHSI